MRYPRVLIIEHPSYAKPGLDDDLTELEQQTIYTIIQLIKSWYTSGTLGIWSSPDEEEMKTANLLQHEFPKAFFKRFEFLRCDNKEYSDFHESMKLLDECAYQNLVIVPNRRYFLRSIEYDDEVPFMPRVEDGIIFRKNHKVKSKFHS